jgi:aminodeoxyfutalosine synthase
VKAYWVMLGRETAQVALRFGADDLDGTVVDERVTRAAGGTAGKGMTVDEIRSFIRGAGLDPVQRDTLYRPLVGDAADDPAARAASS